MARPLHPARLRALVGTATVALLVAVAAPVSAAEPSTHTVGRGETLTGIARRYGTTVSALAAANGIADPNRIRAGQVLVIPTAGEAPGGGDATPGEGGGVVHTVARGETLAGIARRYGTTVAALAAANGIADPNRIWVGQRLRIPAPGATAEGASVPSGYHVVRPGETLAGIARRYGTTVQALREANGLVGDLIFANARLRLAPVTETPPPGGGTTTTVTVAVGDTLSAIARRYGTTIRALVEANRLSDPDRIRAGQELVVPGAGWVCPVPGARFTNDYGIAKPDGRFHEGVDLYAPRGTPVLAPVAGFVEQAEGTRGGLQFRLLGDDGYVYIGTHMDSFGAAGRVTAGTPLGTVGDSGNARGGPTHIHFEMHPGGVAPVNPYPTLREAC